MRKNPLLTISFFFLFQLLSFGQTDLSITKDLETKAYSKAITEYIKAVNKKDKTIFDTLFIGKHDDFPAIQLPTSIQKTKILVITSEEANKKLTYRKLVYLNVIGDISKDYSHFVIVTFHVSKQKSYVPEHNCLIDLKYNLTSNEAELVKLKFDMVYPPRK